MPIFSPVLDAGYGGAQVVERAAAARAAYVLGLGHAQPRRLQYGEGRGLDAGRGQRAVVHQPEAVAESVHHQRAHVGGGLYLEVALLLGRVAVHLAEHDGVLHPGEHHLVHQCALLAEAVGVVGHADHHHLGVGLEAGGVFFGRDAILQHEELDPARHQPDKRHGRMREYRGYVCPGMGGTQRGALAEVGHQHGAFGLAVGSVVAVGAGPVGPRPAVAYIYIVGR